MTNEALALLIQQGDNDELIPVLWEKTNKLLFMLSAEAFSRNKEQLIRHGVELEDLNQESYNVLLGAVRAYDPEKGFVLVSYFSYQFKKLLHRLLSTSDTLDRSETKSLDEPLTTETDGCTLADIIEDPCSSSPYDHAELYGYYDTLYQALDSLPNEDREVIRLMFFSDPKRTLRYQELAERLGGIPEYSARSKAAAALKKLQRGKVYRRLWDMYSDAYAPHFFSDSLSAFRHNLSSGVEMRTIARIRYEERMEHSRKDTP